MACTLITEMEIFAAAVHRGADGSGDGDCKSDCCYRTGFSDKGTDIFMP